MELRYLILHSIVSPILSGKGFERVPIRDFVDKVHHVVEIYGRFIEHRTELEDLLRLHRDGRFSKPGAQLSRMLHPGTKKVHSKQVDEQGNPDSQGVIPPIKT